MASAAQDMRAGPGPSSIRGSLYSNCLPRPSRVPTCSAHRQLQPGPVYWPHAHCCQHTQAPTPSRHGYSPAAQVWARQCCRSSSCCHMLPTAVSLQDSALTSHSHHTAHPSLPQLSSRSYGCLRSAQRQPAKLTSRASRLPPPSASLAFAEPATAVGSVSGAAAGAAAAAGTLSFSKVLAVVLGYCVMAGSLFRSVPQIVKVIQHNSTEGLSLMSYIVELCCYSVVIAYNMSQGYGFNTFGEVVACWIQDIILIALVFKDRRTPPWMILLTAAAFTAGCSFLLSPACPQQLLSTMQASNIAIMALGSRLPQIILNMRRGNAGMLSVTTCLLNVAGNAARIFTTIVLTGDLLMLGGACSQGCLNTILLYQSVSTARARRQAAAGAAVSSSTAQPPQQQQPQPKQQWPQPEATSSGPEGPAGGYPALQPAT